MTPHPPPPALLDTLHKQALTKRRHLDGLIRTKGSIRLGDWCSNLWTPWSSDLPTNDPLLDCVFRHTARLLGKGTAAKLVQHIEHSPNVLTSNHQGLDCYAQTLQGTLLFALARFRDCATDPINFPVLACGNISLNNLTYPQGVLLARKIQTRSGRNETRWAAAKIPIFPRRMQHALASMLPAYTMAMLEKARSRTLAPSTALLDSEQKGVLHLLDGVYSAALDHRNFSDQSTLINDRAWKSMFSSDLRPIFPKPVYLGLEAICTSLLEADFADEHSLVHALLFDTQIRRELVHALDGTVGCWSLKGLQGLLASRGPVHNTRAGTFFFWTIDQKGCKLPMALSRTGTTTRLVPVRSTPWTRGEDWTPAGISGALQEGRILPSLFTSYTVLALARGLVCHGGIYQTEYLPAMQAGLSLALRSSGNAEHAVKIEAVHTNAFCSGHNLAMARYPDGTAVSAGRIELMAAGGITPEHLDAMADLTLRQASLAALPETFAPFLPSQWQSHRGYTELTRLICERLGDALPCFGVT
ncbi:hypothetical protein [Desulfoplanes sp.]